MKRPAAATSGHASPAAKSRRRKATDPTVADRASRSGGEGLDAGGAVAAAVAAIPHGRTRTKMEVFRSALKLLGRGDEAIGTGTRTVLGGHLKRLAGTRRAGWHRVVASDGHFWEGRAVARSQLDALQSEGARPRPGEEVGVWAKRVGAKLVGYYKPRSGGVGRLAVPAREASGRRFDLQLVEPLSGAVEVELRRDLSGGKLFWQCGDQAPRAPPFQVEGARLRGRLQSVSVGARVRSALGPGELACLHEHGAVLLEGVVPPRSCAALLEFARAATFVDTQYLDGEAGRCGRYEFCQRSPALVSELRGALYARLFELSPALGRRYPPSLAALERMSAAAGQRRPANIFLAYGEGGLNLAHQDPYGSVFFPYQAMLMLSRRERDFAGGAFFVKNLSTGRSTEVCADEGGVTLFAANRHAVNGADFKHGVRPLTRTARGRCERFSVGIVFNLRK